MDISWCNAVYLYMPCLLSPQSPSTSELPEHFCPPLLFLPSVCSICVLTAGWWQICWWSFIWDRFVVSRWSAPGSEDDWAISVCHAVSIKLRVTRTVRGCVWHPGELLIQALFTAKGRDSLIMNITSSTCDRITIQSCQVLPDFSSIKSSEFNNPVTIDSPVMNSCLTILLPCVWHCGSSRFNQVNNNPIAVLHAASEDDVRGLLHYIKSNKVD